MSRTRLALFLLCAAASPSLAARAETVAQDAGRDAHYQAAYRLAQALRDEKTTVAEVDLLYQSSAIEQLSAVPELAALETEHPGILRFAMERVRPELERQVIASLPGLWDQVAALIAAEMTDAEIEQARIYYSSPAGMRLKASLLRNYDVQPQIQSIVKDPDAGIKADDIRQGVVNTVPQVVREMTPEDQAVLVAFSKTAAYPKIRKLTGRVLEITAAWANQSSPEDEARISQIMEAAFAEFLTKGSAQ